jgi:exosortase A-associated hydrolase 1
MSQVAVQFEATHVLALRAGALCEPRGLPTLRLAPVTGAAVLRGLLRARVLASKEAGIAENRDNLLERGRTEGLELGGYRLGAQLVRELETAEPSGGTALANISQTDLGGPALWLRAEPDHSPAQAAALATTVFDVLSRTSEAPSPMGAGAGMKFSGAELAEAHPLRRHVAFACEDDMLIGTLDDAAGSAGLLLVTGGNEIRAGTFAGQARLAARIAKAGYPVFRFDRRGVGDSTGTNAGFLESRPDIAAALAAFRDTKAGLKRIVAFGNCDAASALMLARGAGCDALVLANPWTIEQDDGAPPAAAIRKRYADKLRDPKELLRLATGRVSLRKLAAGIGRAMRPAPPPSTLAGLMNDRLAQFSGSVHILLAERDRTAQVFATGWNPHDPRVVRCAAASHAFVEPHARDWLFKQLIAALR